MATSGWARTTGGQRINRTGLSKTSGWSPLAVDAFFPSGTGSTTNKNLSFTGTGTSTLTKGLLSNISFSYSGIGTNALGRVLVSNIGLSYTGTGTSTVSLLKVFLEAFAYNGIGTSSLQRLIRKAFSFAANGSEIVVKRISAFKNYTAIGTVTYQDIVFFSRSLASTAIGSLAFIKSFIGGGGGTVTALLRRGKLIMNKFGRW